MARSRGRLGGAKHGRALSLGFVFAALLGFCLCAGTATFAQEPPAKAKDSAAATAAELGGLSETEKTDLVARLSDTEIRDLLLYYLGQTASPPADSGDPEAMIAMVESKGALIRQNAAATAASIADPPAALAATYGKLSASYGPAGILIVIVFLALFIGVGMAAEWLYEAAVRRLRAGLREMISTRPDHWLLESFASLVLNLLAIATFAVGYVLAFLAVWHGNPDWRHLTGAVLLAIVCVRAARSFALFLFSPQRSGPRLIPLDDDGARYFAEHSVRIALLGASLLITAYLIALWSGDPAVRRLLALVTGVIFVGYTCYVIWRGRHHAAKAFLAGDTAATPAPRAMRLLAPAWAPLVIIYMIGAFVAAVILAMADEPVGATSSLTALLVVILGVPVIDRLIGLYLVGRPAPEGSGAEAKPFRESRVLRRASRIVIAVLAILLVFSLFGVNIVDAATQNFGGRIARLVFDVGVIALIAYVIWELAIAAINRKLEQDAARTAGAGGQGIAAEAGPASRLKTLLPLFRRALQAAIATIAALMVLTALGVNIGPMLAGAGIVGLAVGFGAQTLVKDLISGLFFLLDDAFRVDEYINVGSVEGTVERINVRSLTLRAPSGTLYTIPFGGIQTVANYSRDWAIVKMEFRVNYNTDLNKVKRIFKEIGDDLLKDPELASSFIQPFKFQGVKSMEEWGILVRGKFMALPGTQFQIRKQIFLRVQSAFAKAGIEFAQRRVQVDLPPGQEPDEASRASLARAAGATLDPDPAPVKG